MSESHECDHYNFHCNTLFEEQHFPFPCFSLLRPPSLLPPSGGLFRRNITLQMAARLLISPSQSWPRLQRGRAGERGRREGATAFNAFNYSFQQFAPLATHSLQLGGSARLAEIQIVSLKNKMHSRGKTRDGRGGRRTDMRTAHDWRTKTSLRQHQFAMQHVSFRLH